MSTDTSRVNRFEVIDSRDGRVLTRYGTTVELDLQDDGRTLKVFLADRATDSSGAYLDRSVAREAP